MKNNKHQHDTQNRTAGKLFPSLGSLLLAVFLVIGSGAIFSGCVHHHHNEVGLLPAGGMIYSHTVPETVKLSDYKVIRVKVISGIKRSDRFCCQLQSKIAEMLKKKGLFESVHSMDRGEGQEPLADLHLDAEIVALDKVSGFERMFFDGFAGKAKVVVVNRLKDLKTGQELGTFTTGGKSASGSLASIFAIGTTKQALKYTAKQIVAFIRDHM